MIIKIVFNFFQRCIRDNYIKNFGKKHIVLIFGEQSHYLNFSENFSTLIIIFKYIFYQFYCDKFPRSSVSGLNNFSVAAIAKHFCYKVIFITFFPYVVQQNVLFSFSWYNFFSLFLLLIFHHLLFDLSKNLLLTI